MAVTQQTPLNTYTANGATTSFAFEFILLSAGDLVVQVTDTAGATTTKAIGTDYAVSGIGVATGGTVIFTAAPANGYKVTIYRDTDLVRTTDYQTNGDLPSATLDADFDRLWLALQEIFSGGKGVPNSLRAPAGETLPALGSASARASRVLAFDANGDPLLIVGVDASSAAALAVDVASSINAAKGAGQVGFAQGLAYGASTIGAHAKRFPTAKDAPWLAVGDGTTTDTTALQAFLTANAGGACWIPPGTYKTGALTVPANTWVMAHGATLDFAAAGNVAGLTFAGGGGIIGGTLTGAGNSTYNDNGRAIVCAGTNNSPSAPTYVAGPVILDVAITGWSGYGVRLQYCTGGSVRLRSAKSIGYAGIALLSCTDTEIVGGTVDGVTPGTGAGDAYGIFFDRMETGNETVEPRSKGIRVVAPVVRNVAAASGNNGQGIDTHGGTDCTIIGPVIESCEVGIAITSSSISGVPQLACRRVTVTGATIKGAKVGYGILVSGAITGGSTVNQYAEDVSLIGCTIEGHGIAGDNLTGAIFTQATKRLTVRGGSCKDPACYGVNLGIENRAFAIGGLSIIDPHDNSIALPGAIHVNGNNNTGRFSDITCAYENAGLATNVAKVSVRVSSSLTGLDISFGPMHFIGIASGVWDWSEATSTGINAEGVLRQRGSGTLSAGTLAVTFAKRFPVGLTPKVFIGQQTANICRAGSISVTGFTATGTGTDAFDWQATT